MIYVRVTKSLLKFTCTVQLDREGHNRGKSKDHPSQELF